MKKMLCNVRNPGGGFRGVSGMGVSITLPPKGLLKDQELPEKAVEHLKKQGLHVEVLGEVEEKAPAAPEAPKAPEPAPEPAPAPEAPPADPAPEADASGESSGEEEKSDAPEADDGSSEDEDKDPEGPPADAGGESEPAEASLVDKLMALTKKELVRKASELGLDSSGNKKDLATRLAESGKTADELGV